MFGCQLYTRADFLFRIPMPENRAQLCDRTDAVQDLYIAWRLRSCRCRSRLTRVENTSTEQSVAILITIGFCHYSGASCSFVLLPRLWDPLKTRLVDVDNGRSRLFHMPGRRVPSALRKTAFVFLWSAGEHQSSLCAVIPL